MSALTENRNTKEILCGSICYSRKAEIASGSTIYTGGITALNSNGKAVAASDTSGIVVAGISEGQADGSVFIRTGVFLMDNGTGDEALTLADIGKIVFVVDDHTVGKAGGTYHVTAGILRDVNSDGVCVEIGNGPIAYAQNISVISADPAAAASSNFGAVVVVGTGWTGGTAIATGVANEVYISTGSAWVKLG